jgi:hypothetical protein
VTYDETLRILNELRVDVNRMVLRDLWPTLHEYGLVGNDDDDDPYEVLEVLRQEMYFNLTSSPASEPNQPFRRFAQRFLGAEIERLHAVIEEMLREPSWHQVVMRELAEEEVHPVYRKPGSAVALLVSEAFLHEPFTDDEDEEAD